MPGKDGTPISSTSELQSLVRLLHGEHCRLFTDWHCEDVLNRTLSPLHRSQDVVVLWTMKLTVLLWVTLFLLLSQGVVVLRTALRRVLLAARIPWLPICPLRAAFGRGGGRNRLCTSTLTLDPTAEHVSTSAQGHNGSMFLRMLLKTLFTQCLGWLEEVAHTYECLKSAGFVVDAHSCFRACVTIQNRRRPAP